MADLPFDAAKLRAALADPEHASMLALSCATGASAAGPIRAEVGRDVLVRARHVADVRRGLLRLEEDGQASRDLSEAAVTASPAASRAPPSPTSEAAIVGYRAAADVLGVGREQVRRVVNGLPSERRPTMIAARGGHSAVWWPSSGACRGWWADVHSTPASPAKRRAKRKPRAASQEDTRSLSDRLADLEKR